MLLQEGAEFVDRLLLVRAAWLEVRIGVKAFLAQIWKQLTAGELLDGCRPGRRDLALHQVGEAGDPFRGLGLHGGTDLRA